MAATGFRFHDFQLDPANRQLRRGDTPVELNARYLDALALLVRAHGALVSKDAFHEQVWRGVPVTDEALTQCIRTLRRALGDSATDPRFIETVPKHGYRFIAPVEEIAPAEPAARSDWPRIVRTGAAGTIGGGVAGLIGGLVYGFAGAAHQPGMGAMSVLLVLVCLTALLALAGGAGVAFGIAAARTASAGIWASIAGGAGGGLLIGAMVKLIGLDALDLLVGRSPGDMTGAAEGALLGAGVGLGAWLAARLSFRRGIAVAALTGGAAGVLIPLLGGRLMGGSLDLLARDYPASRLRLDGIGALFGEAGFGPVSALVTSGAEGALFGGCVVAAMWLAHRRAGPAQAQ